MKHNKNELKTYVLWYRLEFGTFYDNSKRFYTDKFKVNNFIRSEIIYKIMYNASDHPSGWNPDRRQ